MEFQHGEHDIEIYWYARNLFYRNALLWRCISETEIDRKRITSEITS